MRDLFAMLRRELAAATATPMGAIVLVAFHLVVVGLFAPDFFLLPTADMRGFFAILPFVLCAVVPAVTMRLWAGERAQGTLELLLALPVRPAALVLGKFAGALAFLAVALASTGVIPVMLGVLGAPDWGQIAASYLGALLLAALFVALGQLASAFAADQTSAFVLGLVACFGVYLAGSDFAATALDGWHPGLGALMRRTIGAADAYAPFARGLVEARGLVFFLAWIALLLTLNGLALEHRGRAGFRPRFALAVALALTVGGLTGHLAHTLRLPRLDLTEGGVHTVSPATAQILGRLPAPIQVTYYVTPAAQMPTELKTLERDVMDRLQAIQAQAPDKVQLRRVYLQAANVLDRDGGSDLERRMLAKGVQPISVAAVRQTGTVSELVYTSLGIAYQDKPEEILPAILPGSLGELEYLLASTALRLARVRPPAVALAAGPGAFTEVRQLLEQGGYQVRPAFLSPQDLVPQADALVLLQPVLSERQRWELARHLAAGGRALVAVQRETWDYAPAQGRLAALRTPQPLDALDWLAAYGVALAPGILMDEQAIALRVAVSPLERLAGGGLNLRLPTHLLVTRQHLADDPLLARVDNLVFLWASALALTDTNAPLTRTPLAWTSPRAWLAPQTDELSPQAIAPPEGGRQSYPVLVRLTGQFPEPQGPPPAEDGANATDTPRAPITPAPGELLVAGSASMFADGLASTNAELLLAAVDEMVFGEELLRIRPKTVPSRVLPPLSPQAALAWKIALHTAVPLAVVALAVATALRRRARRRGLA